MLSMLCTLAVVPLLFPPHRVQSAEQAFPASGAPEDGALASPAPLRFVFVGDYGTTEPESFEIASLVHTLAPRFVVTLGDNNYPDGAASTIDANIGQHYHDFIFPYLGNYGPGAEVNRFWPCLGNHDWRTSGARPYLEYFDLPGNERYYDFVRGPIHFFALDSDTHEPDGNERDSAQARWLEPRLRAANEPFKMVYMHHPAYDSGSSHGPLGSAQWPFREWGATIVLAGHDHIYERLEVGGLTYVVAGLGGQEVDGFVTPIGGSQRRFNDEHGALVVQADNRFAHFWFVTGSGTVADDFVLPAGGLDPGVVPLVAEDAEWRYLDSGAAPSSAWRTAGFDDSSWHRGRAQLGYGEGDETTRVGFGGDTSQRFLTTWFRRKFTVAAPAELERLQLRLLVDDGAVAYVNGLEVARMDMPAGSIGATTQASSSLDGDQENRFLPFDLGPEALARLQAGGNNVLAVEVHQSSPSSNDLSFAADLVGLQAGRVLLARGSQWRYRDSGSPPPSNWRAPDFDDSHWNLGRAELGYGEGDETTQIASHGDTAWFRARFSVSQLPSVRWISCRLLHDDGAIVYLNGREAARIDLPALGVTPATNASFNVGSNEEGQFEETSLDPRLLVRGVNTVAVEIHQASGSSDLSFDLELVAH